MGPSADYEFQSRLDRILIRAGNYTNEANANNLTHPIIATAMAHVPVPVNNCMAIHHSLFILCAYDIFFKSVCLFSTSGKCCSDDV